MKLIAATIVSLVIGAFVATVAVVAYTTWAVMDSIDNN